VLGALALLGAGLAGSAATKAFHHHGFGHGFGFHRAHFMRGMDGPIDPARLDERVERAVKHFAVEVDANADQTAKLTAIAKAAARDLLPLRERVQAARKQGLELMGAATVDRARIEQLRAEQMANAEQFSKRAAQAIGDAAEVLTPEQRKKLADRISERRGWRRG
jgi:Spy/CpxP family protein refolding chaperone